MSKRKISTWGDIVTTKSDVAGTPLLAWCTNNLPRGAKLPRDLHGLHDRMHAVISKYRTATLEPTEHATKRVRKSATHYTELDAFLYVWDPVIVALDQCIDASRRHTTLPSIDWIVDMFQQLDVGRYASTTRRRLVHRSRCW